MNSDLRKRLKRCEDIIEFFALDQSRQSPPRPERNGVVTVCERTRVHVSIGRDHGAWTGDVMFIHRDSEFVAKIELESVDRLWSIGKVILERKEPRLDDEVTSDSSELDLSSEDH